METDRKIILLADTEQSHQDKLRDFYTSFSNQIKDKGLEDSVALVRASDIGIYGKGFAVKIFPRGIVYTGVKESDIGEIIDASVKGQGTVESLLFSEEPKQIRIVLRNCGVIDPESIDEYIACRGYGALKKILFGMDPAGVIEEMKKSGLRGRGGAGYPTWMKWKFTRESQGDRKYVICNADEGDPGAYMDRSVLEGDPHSVIEGLIIAGYAIGAGRGYMYIRAEYPLAVERVKKAIEQAYECGLLGKNILGTDFSFDIDIRLGAGAFVCGEETALIASIEGKRGTPRPRPPYPSVSGLWGKPTAINNVETLANVPYIILEGGDKFALIGTEKSKGTKVFALTGKVRNSGLVEVPMGITLREIVFDIGGGMLGDKPIKAVQTGGPSGGVIPVDQLDTPVDYENLQKLGSIMGSGGMIVMDESDCIVDIAKFYLGFCVEESCGKCAPCRIGGYQMLNLLNGIAEGAGSLEDLDKLRRVALAMQRASLCALGQTAANPVMSTLRYFEQEYREHIVNRKCRSHKCRSLMTYSIIQDKCKRCRVCVINCPVNAIEGDREKGFFIDVSKCVKCGKCFEVCKFQAIAKE
ncbi:MAG: NADH-quinone oxidoreductase subunit NuoF [Candidatus Omnitrophota bacterium]|jgi:NADH:ubiquinone oxidoreductase subunit F (NADH-binding)/NAD-dependent dihydropyrimidine dehydrogenase PreA subunit|nr:NADH-quinone oxidoreductase subunit NuoF [Candidatus Omnitrophota bacterium]MDD5526104.1 NADH-quinone oxidoreductase subunit NuoF [Candidatus Omnitrophota bacterium]